MTLSSVLSIITKTPPPAPGQHIRGRKSLIITRLRRVTVLGLDLQVLAAPGHPKPGAPADLHRHRRELDLARTLLHGPAPVVTDFLFRALIGDHYVHDQPAQRRRVAAV